MTATSPGPVPFEMGTEVDNQVAAPTETTTPKLHRATIAQQRVRIEGWRQRRLGSMEEEKMKKKEKKREEIQEKA